MYICNLFVGRYWTNKRSRYFEASWAAGIIFAVMCVDAFSILVLEARWCWYSIGGGGEGN